MQVPARASNGVSFYSEAVPYSGILLRHRSESFSPGAEKLLEGSDIYANLAAEMHGWKHASADKLVSTCPID